MVVTGVLGGHRKEKNSVKNSFGKGPEGWCSYDYHGSVVAGRNVFVLATWESQGGVGESGYIWTNHARWSADTPERPLSILPLLLYRSWINADPIDLRGAEVSVFLRGDDLQLDGAQCFFWIHGQNTRWHYTCRPLSISDGCWDVQPNDLVLEPDEKRWHCSWSRDPDHPAPIASLLAQVDSYGFSFVGFSQEVRGRLCMDEFAISLSAAS